MSFYHAIEGIIAAIKSEGHLRFHLIITNLIVVFAYFYGLSRTEWAILWVCCAAVVCVELLNTAVEHAVDTATKEILRDAKIAKDAAAGAVLAMAMSSIAVGFCLFGNFARIWETLVHIFTVPKILIPCLALGIFDIIFLIGGKNEK